MPKTRVFISHSNQGDLARKPVQALSAALEARGFAAEYDKMFLRAGDDWYARVNTAMARCDAAIMLVDREAIASEYVRYEAAVLGNRWHVEQNLDRKFVFFAALVDPDPAENAKLGSAHLLEVFGKAAKLDRTQRWNTDASLLGQEDLGPLAESIAEGFEEIYGAPWRDETPLALARYNLWHSLDRLLGQNEDAVAAAISRIRAKDDDITEMQRNIDTLKKRSYAVYLASWLADQAARAPRQMATVVDSIGSQFVAIDSTLRLALHNNLFALHSLWVANDDCPIGASLDTGAGGVIALNGEAANAAADNYTVKLFPAHRMFPEAFEFLIFDTDEHDAAEIATQMSQRFGLLNAGGLSPLSSRNQGLLADTLVLKRWVCLLPSCFARPEFAQDLLALRSKFDGVLFLIPLGQDFDTADIDGAVSRLLPPLDPDTEAINYHSWYTTKNAIF